MAEPDTNPFMKYLEDPPAPAEENPFSKYVAARDAEPEVGSVTEEADKDPGLKQIAPGIYIPADRSIGEYIIGGAETLAMIASSALAEPVAGIAGLGAAIFPGEPGAGARTVEGVREAMTYQPGSETGEEMVGDVASFLEPVGETLGAVEEGLGEATLAATGSPELATAAHAIPTALMEVLGLGLLKKGSQAAQRAAAAQTRMKIDANMTPEQAANAVIEPELRSYEQIATDMRLGRDVSKDVRPDAEILEAAEALGVELNPSHYSTNEAFRQVEQTVKSQPKARLLGIREADAIKKLGERADELVGDRGFLDRSLLDVQVRNTIDSEIKNLRTGAKQAYKRVNDHLNSLRKGGPRVNARASKAYLDARLEEFGGDTSGLSSSELKLHEVLNQDLPPTYARLDQLRREVGYGFKGKGVFGDDLSGNLDQVYGALIRDQQGVADAYTVGADFAAGRKLVQTRKDLEKTAMQMFGKDLNKSILPKLTQAANTLTKGDVTQFKTLMQSLPAELRSKAAATMLNDLFTHGTRTGGSIGAGFSRAYGSLNRNAGAKAEIFKYLPKEVQRRFDAIGTVSEGIYRAKALENTSKTARDILEALESGSAVSRVTGATVDKVLGRMTFHPGPQRWLAAGAQAAKRVGKEATDRVRAADNLLASGDFNRAIAKAMEGDVKQAETMLKRSKAWQSWRGMLGEGTKAQLMAMGPIAWLTSGDEREPK